MKNKHDRNLGSNQLWSAAPTPFTETMDIDVESVERMVVHQRKLGIQGFFLAGTNGEGPWLTESQKQTLLKAVAGCVEGQIPIAFQVTDNSIVRVLENIETAARDGADFAIIAQPYFFLNANPKTLLRFYTEIIQKSALPVGFYDRGKASAVPIPEVCLPEIYAQKNLLMIKDSSLDPIRRKIALKARRSRPEIALLNGFEFNCVDYLAAGYDGLLLGGGVFNGYLAGRIIQAVAAGDLVGAWKLQKRMNRIMYAVYGGKKISCYLSGEKKLLVELCIFRTWKNYPDYPLTRACREAIRRVLEKNRDMLMPYAR